MITTIVTSKRGFLVKLNDGTRLSIEALGSRAEELLQGQDIFLWATASDAGFLRMLTQGAKVLRHFGLYGIIELTDADSHRAFVTCRLLSLRTLEFPGRRTLRRALVILAKCSLVQIKPHLLPPFRMLPAKVKKSSRLNQPYRSMLRYQEVSLWDLLRLRKRLEQELSPEFVPLTCELRKITEGLDNALGCTRTMGLTGWAWTKKTKATS
jgi:hypothetical protein